MYRGRFAPSPTGELHLGGAVTALFCAARARQASGKLVLRIEDIDLPRVVPGSEAGIARDLAWLGIRWDEGPDRPGGPGPYRQSERTPLYEAALAELERKGLVYLCDCSRAEIARIASAPHAGEEGPRYPGTCRPHGARARAFRRPPALRLAVPSRSRVVVRDAVLGPIEQDVGEAAGDFVLRRGDGIFAYQLAVVVDDLAMGVTEVVRGADLAGSAPRQALLAELLGGRAPGFAHLPLLVGEGGARLAKRAPGATVSGQRARGVSPAALLSALAGAYGHPLADADAADPVAELAGTLDWARLPRTPVPLSALGLPAGS